MNKNNYISNNFVVNCQMMYNNSIRYFEIANNIRNKLSTELINYLQKLSKEFYIFYDIKLINTLADLINRNIFEIIIIRYTDSYIILNNINKCNFYLIDFYNDKIFMNNSEIDDIELKEIISSLKISNNYMFLNLNIKIENE